MLSYAIHLRGAFGAEVHVKSAFSLLFSAYQPSPAYDTL